MNCKLAKALTYNLVLICVFLIAFSAHAFYPVSYNKGNVILMYHNFVPDQVFKTCGKYKHNKDTMPVSQFDREMAFLAGHGYRTMLMKEAAQYLRAGVNLPGKTVLITFDDGYESNYLYAYPILQKYNIKANIAVIVEKSLKARGHDLLNYDPASNYHLSFNEMKEMQKSGLVEIGSHSYDGHYMVLSDRLGHMGKFYTTQIYDPLTQVKESYEHYLKRIERDVALSKLVLQQKLGAEIEYFAYPYGVTNESLVKTLKANGFRMAVMVKHGKIDKDSNALTLRRCNVDPGLSLTEFHKILE